jgi:hypothetical protein
VLDALHAWLETHRPLVPAQSALGKAMTYLHNQWKKLTVYATDGRLAIDNNASHQLVGLRSTLIHLGREFAWNSDLRLEEYCCHRNRPQSQGVGLSGQKSSRNPSRGFRHERSVRSR